MRNVAHTWELVPSHRDYDLGSGYFYALSTALPNVFADLHPAIARGTASAWLVNTVEPVLARVGGGLGYSFIPEAYLNFGWFGVVLVPAVIGYAVVRAVAWAERSSDPARLAALACFLPSLLFFARAETTMVVRPLLWYSVAPYALLHFVRRARTRRPRWTAGRVPPSPAPAP